MLYSLCQYQVLLCANRAKRSEYPVTHTTLTTYVDYACRLLGSGLTRLAFSNGCVMLLIKLNVNTTIGDFIDKVKLWTSSWIMSNSPTPDARGGYWTSQSLYRPVSPEGSEAVKLTMSSLPNGPDYDAVAYARSIGMVFYEEANKSFPMVCHHIIIVTSRERLLLPLKYRALLADITRASCSSLGIKVVQCGGMRNHIHILGYLPAGTSVSSAVDSIKTSLLEAMHANRHFRSFEGWSDYAFIYTTTRDRLDEEVCNVLRQDIIHNKTGCPNEMSYLYQKMGITYVTSLH